MVKVLLYGYCTGVAASRRIAQRLHEDIAFRVLAANNTPDFRTISDFRKDHLVPAGGTGEAGACGAGRDQGEGQRQLPDRHRGQQVPWTSISPSCAAGRRPGGR